MQYRLLALDIDGTLLNSRSEMTEVTRNAVQKVIEAGFKVCLVSGRRPRGMVDYARQLGTSHPLVGYNGGVIADPVTQSSLHAVTIPRSTLGEILHKWDEADVCSFAYCNSATPPEIYYSRPPACNNMRDYILSEGVNAVEQHSMWKNLAFDPVRMVIGGSEQTATLAREIASPLIDLTKHKTFFTQLYNGNWYYEIYPLQATKSNGLRYLCEHFSITPEEIIAVGDHINDLDMIEFAGLGVAMGNAQPEVKKRANMTIGHHDEDGLAVFLEALVRR